MPKKQIIDEIVPRVQKIMTYGAPVPGQPLVENEDSEDEGGRFVEGGNCCWSWLYGRGDPSYIGVPFFGSNHDTDGCTRVLLIACDYPGLYDALTCVEKMTPKMEDLCRRCQIQDVTRLYNRDVTKSKITATMQAIGARCGKKDRVVIYFLGHGSSVGQDSDGDEEDGTDEELCLMSEDGTTYDYFRDDDWAALITSAIPRRADITMITDCCNSGTMADTGKDIWRGRNAVNISACKDEESGMDVGGLSLFTECVYQVCCAMSNMDEDGFFSVDQAYKMVCNYYNETWRTKMGGAVQNIQMECHDTCDFQKMLWPLNPKIAIG